MESNFGVVLVNLISEDYLARYQAPLAVNVLSSYFKSKCPNVAVGVIDMQDVFKKVGTEKDPISVIFAKTVESVISEIISICSIKKTIVGLSVKWGTQEIAARIINKVRQEVVTIHPLFVVGNIGSTHGYKELLTQEAFLDIVAVVGEGEEALVEIVSTAVQKRDYFRVVENYRAIQNVAVCINDVIHVAELKRVDLNSYPPLSNINPSDIYDKEWDVYAMETSRGCPWGNCSFCSVKNQFGTSEQAKTHSPDWRWRPFAVDKVLGDIRSFAKEGVRRFDIKDSEFFGPVRTLQQFSETMSRVSEIARGLIAINEELRSIDSLVPCNTLSITHISARVDTIYSDRPSEEDRNLVRRNTYSLLKAAGLRRVYLGIASGSSSQLKRYCKGVSVEENKKAIEILRELGLEIEVGFIFFDYLVTLKELRENIAFIEETHIHDTDSRILGSLRIQKGSPYENLAKRHAVLGKENGRQLCYEAAFVNKEIAEIEAIFSDWERPTRKLSKIIPSHFRIKNYKLDFVFLKDLVSCYESERIDWVFTTVENHALKRVDFFKEIKQAFDDGMFGKESSKIFLEYLDSAIMENQILAEEEWHAKYYGRY